LHLDGFANHHVDPAVPLNLALRQGFLTLNPFAGKNQALLLSWNTLELNLSLKK